MSEDDDDIPQFMGAFFPGPMMSAAEMQQYKDRQEMEGEAWIRSLQNLLHSIDEEDLQILCRLMVLVHNHPSMAAYYCGQFDMAYASRFGNLEKLLADAMEDKHE